ncbi:MAG: hypothetical protein JJE04_27490 [Acidobacteriia bacterium]|nr:hypothetical protein [Terriglobia bacterium]
MEKVRQWLEETHSARFELLRHFFARFFDSDLVSTPGQWRVVAAGTGAVLASFWLLFTQAYYHKYLELTKLDNAGPYRLAQVADALFLISLSMAAIGLLTTLQWTALFPGLRDYFALAALPVRPKQIFLAKFAALTLYCALFIAAITVLPSVVLPAVMSGRHAGPGLVTLAALLLSSSMAAWFSFLSLVGVQGLLLNLLPVGLFSRLSLWAQGFLFAVILSVLPLIFSIPSLSRSMNLRPDWIVYAPPCWFLGLHQVITGNREPMALRLAVLALQSVFAAAAASALTYFWSYLRHRVRVLEAPTDVNKQSDQSWLSTRAVRLFSDPRELGVFSFVGKTLVRSRAHRLLFTGFLAVAVALVLNGFIGLALNPGRAGFLAPTPALSRAAISAPLAFSLFGLAGFAYLFRLPVELRANWLFQLSETGNRAALMAGVERFLIYWAVAPVALLTLPLEIHLLGIGPGIAVTVLCLMPSLILMELLLLRLARIPFTSSYLPGRRPVVDTVVLYIVCVAGYITTFGAMVLGSLRAPSVAVCFFLILAVIWWRIRFVRLEDRGLGKLEFEELPEVWVQTLGIERD